MSGADRLHAFLSESVERIDRHLDKTLPPAGEPPTLLHEAMRYAVFSGGKRLRPALVFASALAADASPDRALPAAGAVELVHTYSLVHDDLPCMDDDAERRGRPTVHVRFGEASAVLVGDALLAEGFAQLGQDPAAARLVARLAEAAGSRALVGGQVDDLGATVRPVSVESITSIHRRKTAALFGFSTLGGGVLADLPQLECGRLEEFGMAYGLAFQLADDLLDDDPEECSILSVLDPAAARRQLDGQIQTALAALSGFGENAWALRALAEALTGRLP